MGFAAIRGVLAPAGIGAGLLSLILVARSAVPLAYAAATVEAGPTPGSGDLIELPRFDPPGSPPSLRRVVLPVTLRPDRGRLGVVKYSVRRGDTAWSIAEKFGLQAETILWGNEGLSAEAGNLQVGRELNIPPVDGVLHTVREGETLQALAAMYAVPAEVIREFPGNGLSAFPDADLAPGRWLVIPGGSKPIAWEEPGPPVLAGQGRRSPGFYAGPLVYAGTGFFRWPVSPIRITQSYWSGHPAIDLDTYLGQPVFASDSGTVIFSNWDSSGYGNLIIVDHGNGYWTYYAHNDANLVRAGDGVLQGQQVAESGSTGNSTGEHLDFRIRLADGGFLNPLDFLP